MTWCCWITKCLGWTDFVKYSFRNDEFVTRCGGRAAIARQILAQFLDPARASVTRFENALAAGLLDEVGRPAHPFRGAAASTG